MANKDAPFGFRPVGELGSDIQNGGTTQYRIANAYASNIFKGDLVFVGDGAVVDQAGNAPTKGTIGVSANTTTIGSNCDQAYAAGATINGQSKSELGALTAAGATAQWVVVGLSKDPDNSDASVANANWIVRLNEGRYLKTTLTAAYP